MATKIQDDNLQRAIDGLPCDLAAHEYFSDGPDGKSLSCVIGHLSKFAPNPEDSERVLRNWNANNILHKDEADLASSLSRIRVRLQKAFGLSSGNLRELQRDNDDNYDDTHGRCLGMGRQLRSMITNRGVIRMGD